MAEIEFFVLEKTHLDEVIQFEKGRLELLEPDPIARELKGWDAKWRMESLEHFLPIGWSFGARNLDGQLLGYFLAQPFLFFRGMTQTLWVEHLSYLSPDIGMGLVDLAYRWGRDKHMQKVVVPHDPLLTSELLTARGRPIEERWIELNSTRLST